MSARSKLAFVMGLVVAGAVAAVAYAPTSRAGDVQQRPAPPAAAADVKADSACCKEQGQGGARGADCPMHSRSAATPAAPRSKCPYLAGHTKTTPPAAKAGKTAARRAAFACPMHPEVTSAEPGRCAKCGMFLQKQS